MIVFQRQGNKTDADEVNITCGKEISLCNRCGHKAGKLYMGELCLRKITEMEFKAVCIVTDPLISIHMYNSLIRNITMGC